MQLSPSTEGTMTAPAAKASVCKLAIFIVALRSPLALKSSISAVRQGSSRAWYWVVAYLSIGKGH